MGVTNTCGSTVLKSPWASQERLADARGIARPVVTTRDFYGWTFGPCMFVTCGWIVWVSHMNIDPSWVAHDHSEYMWPNMRGGMGKGIREGHHECLNSRSVHAGHFEMRVCYPGRAAAQRICWGFWIWNRHRRTSWIAIVAAAV